MIFNFLIKVIPLDSKKSIELIKSAKENIGKLI